MKMQDIVIISTVSSMRTFLDFSDRFELDALDRKNRQTPVKIKKPSPLDNTI